MEESCCAVVKTTALKANFRWISDATLYPVSLPKVYTTTCLNSCTRRKTRWSFTNNAQNTKNIKNRIDSNELDIQLPFFHNVPFWCVYLYRPRCKDIKPSWSIPYFPTVTFPLHSIIYLYIHVF